MNKQGGLSDVSGLSDEDAQRALQTGGYNELPAQKNQNSFTILIRVLSEPMLLLLIGSGALYFFMGDAKDAFMLMSFVFVMIGITYYQERKTEKTLEALRNLSSPRALVIRSGRQIRIPGREVVQNDILIIREGDRIPADAVVLSCENLSVDESLLTGEAIPVRKSPWDGNLQHKRPGGDDLPFVYSGSMAVSGRGIAKVTATGIDTEMGKIGKSLGSIKEEETLLHKETKKIVRSVAFIGIFLCGVVIFIYTALRGNLLQGLLAGLTLSMAMLPEEFPVVLLVFLTLGAWRISKHKVLTRRAAAIETLGAATVLCTDKTGTITLNKMELKSIYAKNSFYEIDNTSVSLPDKFHELLEYGMLASQKDPFDPVEKEINSKVSLYLKNTEHIHENWGLVKEYTLSKELLALSHVWQSPNNKDFVIASKGAPEAILNLCHLSEESRTDILEKVKILSEKGLRVLGVAKARFTSHKLPENQHDFVFEFSGLFGFIDPVRASVQESVREAYEAGIRVILITGDYPGTAQFIAKEIGIRNPEQYITGEELEKIDHLKLREKIKNINVVARVMPEQKLLIVNALKANGEIVAMTGDGVNDAPALKAAHIGIAMGERGTDVARETASLVLLNDDFSSIVAAVRLGRRIFENIKRAMGYILAVHVPIAGMSILPLAFNLPPVLLPAHIAFLELIIDPACSTVFESEKGDQNIMKYPPRNLHSPIFNRKTVLISLSQGLGVLLATFILFFFIIKSGKGELEARSFAFASLVLANLTLIIVNLSWRKNIFRIIISANKTLYIVFIGALLCLFAVLYIPFLSGLFHLTPLHMDDFFLISLVVILSLAWFEGLKFMVNRSAT